MTLWMFFQENFEDQTAKVDAKIAELSAAIENETTYSNKAQELRDSQQALENFKTNQRLPAFYKKIEGVILFGDFVVTANAGFSMPDWWVKGCSVSIAKNSLIGMTYRKVDVSPVAGVK